MGKEDSNRLLAIAIVVAIHLLIFLLLSQALQQPRKTSGNDSPRIHLSWIRREPPSPAPSAPAHRVSHPRETAQPGFPASASEPAPTEPVAPAPTVIANDTWHPAPNELHFKSDDEAVMQRLLHTSPGSSLSAKTILPTLRMRDNSLGGILGRMTRITDCKELRIALSAHPESAETLLRTMTERGCSN